MGRSTKRAGETKSETNYVILKMTRPKLFPLGQTSLHYFCSPLSASLFLSHNCSLEIKVPVRYKKSVLQHNAKRTYLSSSKNFSLQFFSQLCADTLHNPEG